MLPSGCLGTGTLSAADTRGVELLSHSLGLRHANVIAITGIGPASQPSRGSRCRWNFQAHSAPGVITKGTTIRGLTLRRWLRDD